MIIYDIVNKIKMSDCEFKKISYSGWRALVVLKCEYTDSKYINFDRFDEVVNQIVDDNGEIYNVVSARTMRYYFPDLKSTHRFSALLGFSAMSVKWSGKVFKLLNPDDERVSAFNKKHRPSKDISSIRYKKYIENPDKKDLRLSKKKLGC